MRKYAATTTLICLSCDKEFEKNSSNVKRLLKKNPNHKFYCSIYCGHNRKEKNQVKIICFHCKNEAIKFKSRVFKNKISFCSRKCYIDYCNEEALKIKDPNEIFGIRICVECNIENKFFTRDSYMRSIKKHKEFRCRSCAAKKMHIDHADSYLAARPKIAKSVKADMASLTKEEKYKRIENFLKAGASNQTGNVSKLEKLVAPLLSNFGFVHNCKDKVVINKVIPDFINEDQKIIIEVHGDYWHANPKIYNNDWVHPIKKCSAKQIWNKDRRRIRALKKAGYRVIVIWETDIRKNMSKVEIRLQNKLK